MLKNPITTFIGILVALCPVVSAIWPEAKDVCEKLTAELIGLGFIASADGIKKPHLQPVASIGLILILSTALTACAELKSIQEKVMEAVKSVKETALEVVTPLCQEGETPEQHGCRTK